MPAKIMLPTNAKMTAFVCSGRSRPKPSVAWTFAGAQASWSATITPTSIPTMPHTADAATKRIGVWSS